MSALVEIYALRDPTTKQIRYVGKAKCSSKRLKTHIRDSRRRKTPVCLWVAKLVKGGSCPVVEVLEICAADIWQERERHHIAELRAQGDLLNMADGGDEPLCPPEVRAANGRKVAGMVKTSTPARIRMGYLKQQMMITLRSFERRGQTDFADRQRARMRVLAAKVPQHCGEWATL